MGNRKRRSTRAVAGWTPSPRLQKALIGAVLLLALALRLPPILAGAPFSYYGDELHLVKRAMALGTGDLNPHWFHKPALLMYMMLAAYGSYFVGGILTGTFGSVDQFGAHFLNDMWPFIVMGRGIVAIFGVATVYVVYRLGRRAYGSFLHGLTAAMAAAVLFPAVVGSQYVKADVPAGFFLALSFLFFLEARRRRGFGPMVVAAVLAGVAMGTKYYGIILLPGYVARQLAWGFRDRGHWQAGLRRASGVVALFVLGFFAVSPYNFLDPTWARGLLETASQQAGLGEAATVFEPDSHIRYVPGVASALAAAGHFAAQLAESDTLGGGFAILAVLGLLSTILRRRTRWYAAAVAFPLTLFLLCCVGWGAFHVNWRHFNAILPLVCTLLFPGALLLVGAARVPQRWSVAAAVLVLLVPAAGHLRDTALRNLERFRPDTRTAAYRWIVDNIGPESLILLDEYGPILQADRETVRRQRQRLADLPADEAFTAHQDTRLDLVERFPGPDARDFVVLAHPWWLDHEPTPEEIRQSWSQRDASNPIKIRVPSSLAEYRAAGFRYVVTNSRAEGKYLGDDDKERAFPSFVRFYRGLRALEPLQVFDAVELGGRGPTVWIYDLQRQAGPGAVPTSLPPVRRTTR